MGPVKLSLWIPLLWPRHNSSPLLPSPTILFLSLHQDSQSLAQCLSGSLHLLPSGWKALWWQLGRSLLWWQEMASPGSLSTTARRLSWGHPCRLVGVSLTPGLNDSRSRVGPIPIFRWITKNKFHGIFGGSSLSYNVMSGLYFIFLNSITVKFYLYGFLIFFSSYFF